MSWAKSPWIVAHFFTWVPNVRPRGAPLPAPDQPAGGFGVSIFHSDHFAAGSAGNGDLTLWELADPGAAVQAAIELYGASAATAAAFCALTAHFDGRQGDYRFWCTVFSELDGNRRS